MSFDSTYLKQVDLLIDVLPAFSKFDCFALKGGTAINLFIQNMPRLSVDIDLNYLPIEPRNIFLANLTSRLVEVQKLIEERNLIVKPSFTKEKQLAKLYVYNDESVIKIEPNFVIRGSVFSCQNYQLCQRAQDQFLKFTSVKALSIADIYGGKICAALDRQHPRDLFDVKHLFDNQGLTDEIRQAAIVYLISSPRPIHELLNRDPDLSDFERIFNQEFSGMTLDKSASVQDLIAARFHLIQKILTDLTSTERKF